MSDLYGLKELLEQDPTLLPEWPYEFPTDRDLCRKQQLSNVDKDLFWQQVRNLPGP